MKKHVTFVGALHIGFGILGIIGAVVVFFALSFALSFVEGIDIAEEIMKAILVLVPVLICVTSILGIIGGIGVLNYQNWARMLVIVLSALNCLNVPIGTAKGVYSIWALLQDETVDLFNQKAGRVPMN
ncbi:MAG: hypothetical protein V2I37_11195 [Marinilabiliaceae bacterium]|nr:hypothetical protein [Marinilabiliaceae bacterium]